MLAHRERRSFSPEEYLALEERSQTRSEYYQGDIYSMTGGSVEHNQIVRNLAGALLPQLKGGACQLFVSDLRLWVAQHQLFTYPDLYVVCGELPRFEGRRDTLTDATLIVEILSPSTEVYDRGEKFLFYQSLPSFREYVLVAQDRSLLERRTLTRPGEWLSSQFTAAEDRVELASVGADLVVGDLYHQVAFPG
ncbi:MAG: Uma2 family endonuclease [Vulcanimicrobiota bacterium]